MKLLIIGLGSMGKRRIRNFQFLQHEVIGFDPREDRRKEANEKYGIQVFSEITTALLEKPFAIVISTPPDLHMKFAKIAIENKIPFFTEASVVQDEMQDVIDSLKNSGIIGLPSCTTRYHPIVKEIEHLIQSNSIGKPLSFLFHSGQYLPDWHPWEDYRKFYVSKKETGACREIVPFELIWLVKIFGKIDSVVGRKSKVSNLETNIDDIYNVLLSFENKIEASMTIDVLSKFPYRQMKIIGENGVIFADWYEHTVKCFSKENGWIEKKIDDGTIEQNYINGEGPYIEEMKNFLSIIKKEVKQSYTFEDDIKILKILESIEKSSDNGTREFIK